MSRVRFNKVAAPVAPAGNKVEIFDSSTDNVMRSIDENSVVRIMASSVLSTQSIATAGGTTTLTRTSPIYTVFTGTSAQTCVLPDATTLPVGQRYMIDNTSTLLVTVQTSGGATLKILGASTDLYLTLLDKSSAAGTWSSDYSGANVTSGKVLGVSNSLILAGTDATTQTFPATSGAVYSDQSAISNANIPCGINIANAAAQSQLTVAGSAYYITNSALSLPNPMKTGLVIGSTFFWRIGMTKTAAGTVGFNIMIYRGAAGSTADTADVDQSIGVQTAAIDNMMVDVMIRVVSTGANGTYYWCISATNKAATALGFGVATGSGMVSGTTGAKDLTIAGMKFGIGFKSNTGTPTIVIPFVVGQAYNTV